MKIIFFLFLFFIYHVASFGAQEHDPARKEALEEFDRDVNGASGVTDTVAPLSKKDLEEAREPIWDDPWGWDDPFFAPGDEMDYELWRAEHED